jgi:hypothetical protein
MQLEHITLTLFTACNGIRLFAYIPQIHKAATDANGVSAISRTTWSLFLIANVSTVLYALINRSDPWLALCFSANALCCIAIVAIASWRVRRHPAAGFDNREKGFDILHRATSHSIEIREDILRRRRIISNPAAYNDERTFFRRKTLQFLSEPLACKLFPAGAGPALPSSAHLLQQRLPQGPSPPGGR